MNHSCQPNIAWTYDDEVKAPQNVRSRDNLYLMGSVDTEQADDNR